MTKSLKHWNWGAFFLTWIWGLFNRTYIGFSAFLVIVLLGYIKAISLNFFPIIASPGLWKFLDFLAFLVILAIHVMHGMYGSRWSWASKKWRNEHAFIKAQRLWAILGWLLFLGIVLSGAVFYNKIILNNTMQNTFSIAKDNVQLQQAIGKPIRISWLSLRGRASANVHNGAAFYRFTVHGQHNIAAVYVQLVKHQGFWSIAQQTAVVPVSNHQSKQILLYGESGYIKFKN